MKKPWLPTGTAPVLLETDRYRLRPLRLQDVILDFDAVHASRKEIQFCFGPLIDWPTAALTIAQDMVRYGRVYGSFSLRPRQVDLGWHEKEFELSLSYTFTVMSLDETRCLGCCYVLPAERTGFDAQVIYWARSGEVGLEEHLGSAIRNWLTQSWPFHSIAFPGRDQSWEQWAALPEASA
jgi:hypothetical protein